MICKAIQYSDQMNCTRCNLVWDADDPYPPICRTEKEVSTMSYKDHDIIQGRDPDHICPAEGGCVICDGGLSICRRCGKAESQLDEPCIESPIRKAAFASTHFIAVPDEAGAVKGLIVHEGVLVVACENGVYILSGGGLQRLDPDFSPT